MIGCIPLLRNIGQFDSVADGAAIRFTRLTLGYAENGRGKTTLAAILRSVRSGDPRFVLERKRLGAAHPPHVVLRAGGQPIVFEHGIWANTLPQIAVFDDAFVAENVCSGMEVEVGHRQKLHELILGAHGVTLLTQHQAHVARIEEHNRALRIKGDAIPAAARGNLSVDAFCALQIDNTVDASIDEIERSLAAAKSAEAIRQTQDFRTLDLPSFDTAAVEALLKRTLPDLEAAAAARVQAHLKSLGRGAEIWIGDGMSRIRSSSAGHGQDVCPFCAQDLSGSALLQHYQVYFSEAYADLRRDVASAIRSVSAMHGGDAPAAFERAVRVAVQTAQFWKPFTQIPDIAIDTAALGRTWQAARDRVLEALERKQASPLEVVELPVHTTSAIWAYDEARQQVSQSSASLLGCNAAIALVKERSATANLAALNADLARHKRVQARGLEPTATRCNEYLSEKAAKAATEQLRDQAREALDNYRLNVFTTYEGAINTYLQRFNAGFRLGAVSSVNTRSGASCSYNVLINGVAVPLSAEAGPSFKNTLSAGDRNTLALAFFFASLDQEPLLAETIVLIDDPMTSLDEHRSLTTVQEMRRLLARVRQVVVLSHSKPFLCALWEGANVNDRSAFRIVRQGAGSTLALWDVRQDCITEHDRRHELVGEYLRAADPARESCSSRTARKASCIG